MSEEHHNVITIIKRRSMLHSLQLFQQKEDVQFLVEIINGADFLGAEDCRQALIEYVKKASRQKKEKIGSQFQTEKATQRLKIMLGRKLAKHEFFGFKQDFFDTINQAAMIRTVMQEFPKAQQPTLEKKLRLIIDTGDFPKDLNFTLAEAIDWEIAMERFKKLGLSEDEIKASFPKHHQGRLYLTTDRSGQNLRGLEFVRIDSVLKEQDV